MGVKNSGIVKKDVETIESLNGFLDSLATLVGKADIAGNENRFAAGFCDLSDDGAPVLLVAASQGYPRPLSGEEDGGGPANAGSAAGDESNFVGKAHGGVRQDNSRAGVGALAGGWG